MKDQSETEWATATEGGKRGARNSKTRWNEAISVDMGPAPGCTTKDGWQGPASEILT